MPLPVHVPALPAWISVSREVSLADLSEGLVASMMSLLSLRLSWPVAGETAGTSVRTVVPALPRPERMDWLPLTIQGPTTVTALEVRTAPALDDEGACAVHAGDGLCAGGEVRGAVGKGDGHGDVGGTCAEDEGAVDSLNGAGERGGGARSPRAGGCRRWWLRGGRCWLSRLSLD